MPVDPDAAQPLYRQLAGLLRDAIYAGIYPSGSRLPTEPDLMAEHGVSRVTVRLALGLLRDEGLIHAQRGRGTFVRDHRPVRLSDKRHAARDPEAGPFTAAARAQGLNGRMVLVTVDRVGASADVADQLQLAEGDPVVRRVRHALIEDLPVQVQTSYFPATLADGTPLARRRFLPAGTYATLRTLGRPPSTYTETIAYGPPTGQETAILGQLATVARIIRITRDDASQPLELLFVTANAARHLFVYEDVPVT
jgi:GntR family transcriptional regulator